MQENLYISNSKRKKHNIFIYLKLILFILLLFPSLKYIGNKYASASTENLINSYNEKRFNEFYNLPENSLDIVFLGSSHSYCTFDPEIFDKNLNTSSFQMGMPLQHLDSTYFTLLEILNYQSPELVVLEVYWDMLDDEFELKQAGMLFQVLKNKELEKQYIKEVFPLSEKIKYNTNVFKYQQDYFAYKSNKLNKKLQYKFDIKEKQIQKQEGIEQYRSKGYTYCNYKMLDDEFDKTNQFKNFDAKNWKVEKSQQKYLQKIIDLCKSNKIQIILVTAPIANISFEKIKNYDIIYNTINEFAVNNGLKYLDYNLINKNEKLLTNDNFRDDAHLNHSGVEIVDNHFINWIKSNIN